MSEQQRTRRHFVLDVHAAQAATDLEMLMSPADRPLATYELAMDPSLIAHIAEEDPANTLMDLYIARTRWMH